MRNEKLYRLEEYSRALAYLTCARESLASAMSIFRASTEQAGDLNGQLWASTDCADDDLIAVWWSVLDEIDRILAELEGEEK